MAKKKTPALPEWQRRRNERSELAARLAQAADENGLTEAAVLRFSDLVKQYRLRDADPEVVEEARGLNAARVAKIVAKLGATSANTRERAPQETKSKPAEGNVPSAIPQPRTGVKKLKVKAELVVALLESAGYKTASKFTEARLRLKIAELPAFDWRELTPSSPKLLDALITAVESGHPITLLDVNGEEIKEEAEAPVEAPAKKPNTEKVAKKGEAEAVVEEAPKKKSKKSMVVTDEKVGPEEVKPAIIDRDGKLQPKVKRAKGSEVKPSGKRGPEGLDTGDYPRSSKKKWPKIDPMLAPVLVDEDEASTKKIPTKKLATKPKKGEVPKKVKPSKATKPKPPKGVEGKRPAKAAKGPGVIGTILELLVKATEKKPMSKEGLLAGLVKAFPEREPDAMAATINAQVPSRLAKEKRVLISRNHKGYWIAT